jgi:hypothetical protein
MIAELNRNDISELRLVADKAKMGGHFDAGTKLHLLLDAYDQQTADNKEVDSLRELIEDTPTYAPRNTLKDNLDAFVSLFERVQDAAERWDDVDDEKPLDETVETLVSRAENGDAELKAQIDNLTEALRDVLRLAIRTVHPDGAAERLAEIRMTADEALS